MPLIKVYNIDSDLYGLKGHSIFKSVCNVEASWRGTFGHLIQTASVESRFFLKDLRRRSIDPTEGVCIYRYDAAGERNKSFAVLSSSCEEARAPQLWEMGCLAVTKPHGRRWSGTDTVFGSFSCWVWQSYQTTTHAAPMLIQVEAMLDKTICTLSNVFIGSSGSTFTQDIFRLGRGGLAGDQRRAVTSTSARVSCLTS
jgi:hypothetical protein